MLLAYKGSGPTGIQHGPVYSSLSPRFNGHFFPGGPGLADTRMCLRWILLQLRMTEVVGTTGATRSAKLQSKCHHQQNNTHVFYRPDALPVTQPRLTYY